MAHLHCTRCETNFDKPETPEAERQHVEAVYPDYAFADLLAEDIDEALSCCPGCGYFAWLEPAEA